MSDYLENATTTISMRLPITMLKEIDAMCKNSPFRIPEVSKIYKDRTDAFKSLLAISIFIEKNKKTVSDPKFVEELNQMIHEEKYMDWLSQLSPMQLKGLRGLIDIKMNEKQTSFNF